MSDATSFVRVALCVEYDGSAYSGWQTQKLPAVKTIQEELEAALSQVANHPIKLICAGRTDAGVHGSGQIVHFDTTSDRPEKAWVRGANSCLKGKICVVWAKNVSEDFHARFSAHSRRYRYVIYNHKVRPALMQGLVTHHYYDLDVERMHQAAQHLLGKHDFSAYRGASCQANTPTRTMIHLNVERYGDYIIVDVKANAFLLHMVRNIVGVLLEIGEGRREPEWSKTLLELKDRSKAGVTSLPHGLYLVAVGYPEEFNLPQVNPGPAFLRPFISA